MLYHLLPALIFIIINFKFAFVLEKSKCPKNVFQNSSQRKLFAFKVQAELQNNRRASGENGPGEKARHAEAGPVAPHDFTGSGAD